MDNNKPKSGTVPVYDPKDKTTVQMPARELAPGMVQVSGPSTGGPAFANARELASTLKASPIVHPPLDLERKQLMQLLSEELREVNPMTPDEWELGFRKDLHINDEIAKWAALTLAYTTLVDERVDPNRPHNMRQKQKRDYYNVLLQCICVPRENALRTIRPLEIITMGEAEDVVAFFFNIDKYHSPDIDE